MNNCHEGGFVLNGAFGMRGVIGGKKGHWHNERFGVRGVMGMSGFIGMIVF